MSPAATAIEVAASTPTRAPPTGDRPPPRHPRRRSAHTLFWRIFLATAAVVAVVLAGTLAVLSVLAARTADAAVARGLEQTQQLVTSILTGRERTLAAGALVFAEDPVFRGTVLQQRRSDLLDQATEAVERTGATWVQITDALGRRLAKSDEPAAPPDVLAGSALILGALDGAVTTGAGISGDTLLVQTAAVPVTLPVADAVITDAPPQVIGVLMAAQAVDTALARSIKQATASEIVFYVVDTAGVPHVVASTLRPDPAVAAFVRDYARLNPADSASEESGEVDPDTAAFPAAELAIGGVHYLAQGRPLLSAGGDPLGGFVAFRSRESEMAPFAALRTRIVFTGLLGLALACILSYFTARRIARPVLALADATRRVAEGDYSVEVPVRDEGEIGTLADAMRSMVSNLHERQALAEFATGVRALPDTTPSGFSERERAEREAAHAGASSGAIAPGRTIARRYAIVQVLGVGGTGVVYKATDAELGETVAIKTLRPDILSEEPGALERLKSEIRLARRISHRNVVRIHDLGEADGVPFISMELVAGTSLTELIRRAGTIPVPVALAIAKQLCRALEAAHEQGIIHRDIKPQNLMVQPDGVLKVMDFGIARLARRTTRVTRTGMVVGTPAYMAPEQLLDEDVDGRADLFAVGVVLYECLTGRRPYEADSAAALIGKLVAGSPTPPREVNPAVPAALSDLVLRLLASEREARPASAVELHELLDRVDA